LDFIVKILGRWPINPNILILCISNSVFE
jgi:hypothetical protein